MKNIYTIHASKNQKEGLVALLHSMVDKYGGMFTYTVLKLEKPMTKEDIDIIESMNCKVKKTFGVKNWRTYTIQGNNLTVGQSDYIFKKLTTLVKSLENANVSMEEIITHTEGDLIEN